MQLFFMEIDSPVGVLKLVANDISLIAVLWENETPNRVRLAELIENKQHPILLKTQKQLSEYFEGQRKVFDYHSISKVQNFNKKFGKLYLPFHLVKHVVIKILQNRLAM